MSYAYNSDDHRTAMTLTSLSQTIGTQYGYVSGLIDSITRNGASGGPKTWQFGYDDLGRRRTMSSPNGLTTTWDFDPTAGWLTETKVTSPTETIMRAAYTHDDVGNRLTKTLLSETETYKYDGLDRLTSATRATGGQAWSYDAVGNRTIAEEGGVARDATFDGRNRLLTTGATGSLLVTGDTNEAASVSVNGQPASMLSGSRFEKRVPFTGSGTQPISVEATDASGNVRSSQYEMDVSNALAANVYDENGSLTQKTEAGHVWAY